MIERSLIKIKGITLLLMDRNFNTSFYESAGGETQFYTNIYS